MDFHCCNNPSEENCHDQPHVWVLAVYADKAPSAENWRIKHGEIPKPITGHILVKAKWISVDPQTRGRISGNVDYATGVRLGAVIRGSRIGKVMESRHSGLDGRVRGAMTRLFLPASGVGAAIARSVASIYDDVSCFPRSSSANLYEAANTIQTGQIGFSSLRACGLRITKSAGFRQEAPGFGKAKVAAARKLAVILPACGRRRGGG